MKLKRTVSIVLCGLLAMSCFFLLSGCRHRRDDAESAIGNENLAAVLYQTYCEDSYKGYQADNVAALTFYVDGTYTVAHCTAINYYTVYTGTWTVENGQLSLYGPDGGLVGNSEGTDLSDISSWPEWGVCHWDNQDGTVTDYFSTYAFDAEDNGDFVLYLDDQSYYYWAQNGHISSQYSSAFTANEFIEAYNAEFGENISSISLNMGTASPASYYECTIHEYMFDPR